MGGGRLVVLGLLSQASWDESLRSAQTHLTAEWLLGFHATREDVGLVGAKGFEPPVPAPPIVTPEWIASALAAT